MPRIENSQANRIDASPSSPLQPQVGPSAPTEAIVAKDGGHAIFVRVANKRCSAYGLPLLSVVLVAFARTMSLTSLVAASLAAVAL
jgi:hypothetical protein